MSIKVAAINSALATAAKLLGGLVTIKVLALFIGAEGLGRIGNAFSAAAVVSAMASCGISLGVTRYIGQHRESPIKLRSVLWTSSCMTLAASLLLTLLGLIFAERLSDLLFRSPEFSLAIRLSSCLIIPIGYASLGIAIVNGFSETRLLVWLQAVGSGVGCIGLLLAVACWNNFGAIFGLFWILACPTIFLLILVRKYLGVHSKLLIPKFDRKIARSLVFYALSMLVTVLVHNFVQIMIRERIELGFGLAAVGYWQGMLRISDAYLQVFSVFLVAYLLPRLSQELDKLKALKLIRDAYAFLVPAVIVVLLLTYFCRVLIVDILLSRDFLMTSDLFLPQLIADFFRILSYIPGFLILARGNISLLMLADLTQGLLLLWISPLFISWYGAQGACLSYALAYFICFLISIAGLFLYSKNFKISFYK
ncbi:oligosaccharide flippase family protein [Polynucleobacter paneuropaeus]|nr:oligosaccharide flippase family protein [Polynucleobacter paneuropaeus]